MKPFSLFLLALLPPALTALAQPGTQRPSSERLEALRIAFMTEQLALTPEESKAFWPLHEAFEASMEAHREAMRVDKEQFDPSKSSASEFRLFLEGLAEQRKAMVDLESQHMLEVSTLLGAERALKLPEMKRELAASLRDRMNTQGRQGPPGSRQEGSRSRSPHPQRSRMH